MSISRGALGGGGGRSLDGTRSLAQVGWGLGFRDPCSMKLVGWVGFGLRTDPERMGCPYPLSPACISSADLLLIAPTPLTLHTSSPHLQGSEGSFRFTRRHASPSRLNPLAAGTLGGNASGHPAGSRFSVVVGGSGGGGGTGHSSTSGSRNVSGGGSAGSSAAVTARNDDAAAPCGANSSPSWSLKPPHTVGVTGDAQMVL